MNKKPLEKLSAAYRLLNPGCVVLVTVGDENRDNIFTVTWNMPLRREPGMVALLSGKRHFSYPYMVKTGEFGLNIPDASIAEAVLGCGSVSGKTEPDKFARFGLTRQLPVHIKAPLIAEAVGSLECRICQIVDLGASSLLIAQILSATVVSEHFQAGTWIFDNGLRLLHHLGGKSFCVSDQALVVGS
ncbi:flavin reductase family protein [candidate division CSSED10-310 bacterium]|uniref:Flavin reductase family protein n=1 Tax=candidate division CSSED10-310 bacterium TaxID=2855610 RepID=A0ABV6YRJ0_UNCC1